MNNNNTSSRKCSIHQKSLEEYVSYMANLSGWEIHEVGSAKIVLNGSPESLFNYVFCDNDITEQNIEDVLKFLKDINFDVTWAVEPNFHNLRNTLEKNNIKRVSNPKKAYIDINNFHFASIDRIPLEFCIVNDDKTIEEFDRSASEIFHHKFGVVSLFFRGLKDNINANLKSFLIKIDGKIVGICSVFIHDNLACFYADGVYKNFRRRGIGSNMIAERVRIAKELGCKSAIAHCMSQSVNMYERLGFKMLGTLYLYCEM